MIVYLLKYYKYFNTVYGLVRSEHSRAKITIQNNHSNKMLPSISSQKQFVFLRCLHLSGKCGIFVEDLATLTLEIALSRLFAVVQRLRSHIVPEII